MNIGLYPQKGQNTERLADRFSRANLGLNGPFEKIQISVSPAGSGSDVSNIWVKYAR
jgi:hypothetical protein